MSRSPAPPDPAKLARTLLAWYDRHRRGMPWRAPPGAASDPYHVWLSEIMLQQTTVKAVAPYYLSFLQRWPDVKALAAAPLDEVLAAWAGLGYYARARNLHACARAVASGTGRFPDTEAGLLALPGIGPYSAAAIAAIAFGRKAVVVDGNVERVIARLFAIEDEMPGAKKRLKELAGGITPEERCGDYAQALMDLGATLCSPKNPACAMCPWADMCQASRLGIAESLPRRAAKADRPIRWGIAFWTRRADGAVLLRRRPDKGLLGGMLEIPSTDWRGMPWRLDEALDSAPADLSWRLLPGSISHVFTHFRLEMSVATGDIAPSAALGGEWCAPDSLETRGLPTLMKKVARHARAMATEHA